MEILGPEGERALAAAKQEVDPASLGAAERLRREFPPELVAAALTQVKLRRRARSKLPQADRLFLTPDGLEQATRWPVAKWRAGLLADQGKELWDLGCGLGVDALACAEAGMVVHAVEADATTAAFAAANLPGCDVRLGLAEDADPPMGDVVFLDPSRRGVTGRTWNVAAFTPPWSLVEHYLTGDWATCVKLGPGLPKPLIPPGVGAAWVSEGGDVVEVSLWNRLEPGPRAVVIRGDAVHTLTAGAEPLPVGPPGEWIHEPDGAVVRSGLVAEATPGTRLLAAKVAYTTSAGPLTSPFVTDYRIVETLDYDIATLRRWVKANRVGSLEIKRRAIDVDPAALRRQLKPKGDRRATLLLARTIDGARAFVVERG